MDILWQGFPDLAGRFCGLMPLVAARKEQSWSVGKRWRKHTSVQHPWHAKTFTATSFSMQFGTGHRRFAFTCQANPTSKQRRDLHSRKINVDQQGL